MSTSNASHSTSAVSLSSMETSSTSTGRLLESYLQDINSLFDLEFRDLEITIAASSLQIWEKEFILDKLHNLEDIVRSNVECPTCGAEFDNSSMVPQADES